MKVERTIELRAEPAVVWDALTNPERTKLYFFGCEALSDWTEGSKLDYRMEFEGKPMVVVTGEIRAITPGRYLEHTCRGVQGDTEGPETVATYTLTPTDGGTQLAVTQGEFADDDTSGQHGASWDQVLAGLRGLVEPS